MVIKSESNNGSNKLEEGLIIEISELRMTLIKSLSKLETLKEKKGSSSTEDAINRKKLSKMIIQCNELEKEIEKKEKFLYNYFRFKYLNKKVAILHKINYDQGKKNEGELGMSKFVIRGNHSGFTSTEPETYGQEVKHDTREEAEYVLEQIEKSIPNDNFEIVEVSS